jgi:hypothetical protein
VAWREPPQSTPAMHRTMMGRSMRRTVVTVLGEIQDLETALRGLRRGARLVVGELFGDPHLVAKRALRLRAQPAADGSRG